MFVQAKQKSAYPNIWTIHDIVVYMRTMLMYWTGISTYLLKGKKVLVFSKKNLKNNKSMYHGTLLIPSFD
jgi:hypothetical protein